MHTFQRVATGTLVRCSQIINNARIFYAAYVMAVKRAPRPYRLGKDKDGQPINCDVALQVRTHMGNRLIGLDAVSNDAVKDEEMARFKVHDLP